jgi:hypothetical protein
LPKTYDFQMYIIVRTGIQEVMNIASCLPSIMVTQEKVRFSFISLCE